MLLYAHLMANPRNRRGKTANNPIDIHVGNRVRICRRLRNLSQAQLGDKIGVIVQQIYKYESAANRIGASRLFALSEVLGVPVSHFFEDMPEAIAGSKSDMPALLDFDTQEVQSILEAYYAIEDRHVRSALFQLAKAMARSNE